MYKMLRKFQLLLCVIFASCTTGNIFTAKIGVDNSIYNSMSETQKILLIDGYNKTNKIKRFYKYPARVDKSKSLNFTLYGGSAMFWSANKRLAYLPVEGKIYHNSCGDFSVHAKNADFKTNIKICYYNHEVWLDPSKYKPEFALYSARIFESSLWEEYPYLNIHTSGYANFDNINIKLKVS